jgi:hypothetical protein
MQAVIGQREAAPLLATYRTCKVDEPGRKRIPAAFADVR